MLYMNTSMKRLMAEPIREFRLPRYGELPDMGLYLEQVVKYLNTRLAPLGCLEITPSMVSNYVKKNVLPKPIKKQYYAEHIAYLFFVMFAKNLACIEDIGLLITIQKQSYTLPVAYDYLCEEMENTLAFVFGLKTNMDEIGVTQSDEKALMRNLIFSAAHVIHMNACFRQLRTQGASES